jgi:hypothetical protein
VTLALVAADGTLALPAALAAATAGLRRRQRWAYVFAAVFLVGTTVVYAVVGASAGGEALTGTSGGGRACAAWSSMVRDDLARLRRAASP